MTGSRSTAAAAGPFRRRTLVILATVGSTGLALMLLYMLFGPREAGVAPMSRSAVGYRAVVRMLQAEVPVRPARGSFPPGAAWNRGVLVLDPPMQWRSRLEDLVVRAAAEEVPVVVVLPKWDAVPNPVRREWALQVELRPEGVVAATLAAATGQSGRKTDGEEGEGATAGEAEGSGTDDPADAAAGAEVAGGRGDGNAEDRNAEDRNAEDGNAEDRNAGGGHGRAGGGDAGLPYDVVRPETAGSFTVDPSMGWGDLDPDLPRPQLFRDPAGHFEPRVWSPEGILVAEARNLPLWVVSDPDLLNVAGLGRGDNALLVHRLLIGHLEPEAWYVREGHFGALPPEDSVWSGLLRPPLSVVSLHLALVALLVSWVAAERFGRSRVPPPRVPPGKRTLVDNTARLLETAGDPREALQRYLDLTARRAAERLGLPPGMGERERLHRLDRIGQRRGAASRLRDHVVAVGSLPARGPARRRRAVQVAADLHRWYRQVCTVEDRR